MKAMLLAAGRGERMRPLSDACPKPLLEVGGKPLIVWHLERLRRAGFSSVVINHAWLGHMIERALGDGAGFGLRIDYAAEGTALETAGGIAHAAPLLGEAPFLAVNADVYCEFDFGRARTIAAQMAVGGASAWLVMTPNPPQNPRGDFTLAGGRVSDAGKRRLTFSGIGVYLPVLFASISRGSNARLAPLLREAMARGAVAGERFDGRWEDVGTPQRLAALDRELRAQPG